MWVLFRDEHGKAACVHDECAHRACPLSLGSVEAGRVQCAYHGACLLSLFPSFASPFVGALETATNGRWLAASKPPGQTLRTCRHADGRSVQDHAPRSGILGATASSPAPPMCRPAGWQFNSRGECTKMPSTAFCKVLTRAASQPAGLQTSHRCCCPRGVAHSGGAWNGACRRTPPHCSSFSPAPCSRSAVSPVFPFVLPPVARSQGIKVKSLPVVEADGLVWVWPGSEEAHAAAGPPPSTLTAPPSGFQVGPLPAPHHGWFLISSRKMHMPAALASLNSHWGWLSARQLSRSSSTRPLAPPAGCTVSLSSLAPSVTLSTLRLCPGAAQVHAELVLEVPVEHGLLLENLLDLAHAPFTHTTTFAKGWPVPGAPARRPSHPLPDSTTPPAVARCQMCTSASRGASCRLLRAEFGSLQGCRSARDCPTQAKRRCSLPVRADVVRFNAAQILGGNWEPYPIDMQFGPPCMVLSTIGGRGEPCFASEGACAELSLLESFHGGLRVPSPGLLTDLQPPACACLLALQPSLFPARWPACRPHVPGQDRAGRPRLELQEPPAPAARVPAQQRG